MVKLAHDKWCLLLLRKITQMYINIAKLFTGRGDGKGQPSLEKRSLCEPSALL